MKLLLKSLISVIVILLISACSSTWKFQENAINSKQKTPSNKMVVIEQMEERWSPRIKTFKHFDQNIFKESAGRRYNDAYAVNRIETPPGKVELGIILNRGGYKTLSHIEFNAKAGQKYLLTWICIPYTFIAVVDEKTSKIVALDSGCYNCKWLIGTKISNDTECIYERLIPRPIWGKFNRKELKWEYNPPFDKEKLRGMPTGADLARKRTPLYIAD